MISVNFGEYFAEQVKHRYKEPTMNQIDGYNMVSTSIPHDIATGNRAFPSCNRVISPNIATMAKNSFGSNYIPANFLRLCSLLNIDFDELRNNMDRIRDKEIKLVSIGYGGFSINVIHFMHLLGKEVGRSKWLNQLTIHEDDNISLTNSFRIYKDMSKFILSENATTAHKFELIGDDMDIASNFRLHRRRLEIAGTRSDTVYFGAPDFETRKRFERSQFIFTGHSGDEVEFYSRPVVDSDLTRETYGKIDIDYFFLNILKSAEKLIDILANTELGGLMPDTKLFQYNAKESVSR